MIVVTLAICGGDTSYKVVGYATMAPDEDFDILAAYQFTDENGVSYYIGYTDCLDPDNPLEWPVIIYFDGTSKALCASAVCCP